MNTKILIPLIYLCIFIEYCVAYKKFEYVDFAVSMKLHKYKNFLQKNPLLLHTIDILQKNYEQLKNDNLEQTTLRIPKIIHQIWLGSVDQKLPERFCKWQKSILDMHPDWQYILWTEKDIDSFPFINREAFDREKNLGAKSDVWRFEILYRYGGVYLDVDMQAVRPLDELHYLYDFYIGIQPLDTDYAQLGIGIVGSRQAHPLLKAYIYCVNGNNQAQIIIRTGPVFFTHLFLALATKTGYKDIALPASYFYPVGYTDRNHMGCTSLPPEAYTIHHWAGSWLTTSY